jgi:hypothetical protein
LSSAVNSELNSVAAACYNSYQDGYGNGGYNQASGYPAYTGDELAGYGPVGPDDMP